MATTPSVLAHALQAARSGNVRKYTEAHQRDPAKEAKLADAFRTGVDPDILTQMRMNPEVSTQVACILNGKVTLLTRPTLASEQGNNGAVVLASLGNDIDTISPVKMAKGLVFGHFGSLIPQGLASGLQLPTAPEPPESLESPQINGANGPAPGFARLHFEVHDADDAAVLVVLPNMLPVPKGTPVPEGHDIMDPVTEEESPWKLMRAWLQAHRYVVAHNQGVSVLTGGTLFLPNAFTATEFDRLPLLDNVAATEVTLLFPQDPHFQFVSDIVRQEQRATWCHIAESIPANVAVGGASDPVQFAAMAAGAVTAALQQSPAKRSGSDEEYSTHAADIRVRYEIAFASLQPADSDNPQSPLTVVPAKLTAAFQTVLATTKPTIAMRLFSDSVNAAIKKSAESDSRIGSGCTLIASQFDGPMLTRVRNYQFLAEPLVTDPSRAQTDLSPFNFLTVPVASVEFQDRVHAGMKLEAQVLMGEDAAKQAKRQTNLFYQGQQETLQDVLACCSNLYVLGSLIVENFDQSALWQALDLFYRSLSTQQARTWFAMYGSTPGFGHNLVLDASNIMIPFMALGNQLEYRSAITEGRAISPQAYQDGMQQAQLITQQLAQYHGQMQPGRYTTIPVTWTALYPNLAKQAAKPVAAPPAQPAQGGTPAAKPAGKPKPKGGSPPKPTPPGTPLIELQTPGLLVYPEKGRFNYPKILVPTSDAPNATKTSLCMNFLVQNRACKYGSKCSLFHAKTLADLPEDAQAELIKYVKDTPKLDFAPGQGPPEGTTD